MEKTKKTGIVTVMEHHKISGGIAAILKKELAGYFTSAMAYIFIVIFLLLTGFFTFYVSNFFEAGQADLRGFFDWHPWIFIFLVPAISMRLWADEKRVGTIELIFTYPVSVGKIIFGKFLAAWIFIGLSLFLTFPIVISVIYLGDPDMGAIFCAYAGSFLMAGAFLSVGAMTSSMTQSQVVSFIISVSICLFFILTGYPPVSVALSGWAPLWLEKFIIEFSFLSHFHSISRGIIDMRDIVYYFSIIFFMLSLNRIILDKRRV